MPGAGVERSCGCPWNGSSGRQKSSLCRQRSEAACAGGRVCRWVSQLSCPCFVRQLRALACHSALRSCQLSSGLRGCSCSPALSQGCLSRLWPWQPLLGQHWQVPLLAGASPQLLLHGHTCVTVCFPIKYKETQRTGNLQLYSQSLKFNTKCCTNRILWVLVLFCTE